MDELEIDGKKYLSSRRAAKEHKYHIDYIGQLIRAGKVVGKKVGRSWYVEAASLKSYLAQEGGVTTSPAPAAEAAPVAKEEVAAPQAEIVIETPAPVVIHAPVVEKVIEPTVAAKQIDEAEDTRKVFFSTPEKESPKPTLQYVADDEPMLPVLNGRMRANADFIVPVRRVEEEEIYSDDSSELVENSEEEELVEEKIPSRSSRARARMPSSTILIAGLCAIILLVAVSSVLLTTSIKVEEGQPASVGIGIK